MIGFWKMHGCGNDFVVVESGALAAPLNSDTARAWADRRVGVGCDQVLVVDPPQAGRLPQMAIFNADGSSGAQCGNGLRCVAWYLQQCYPELGRTFRLASPSGEHTVQINSQQDIAVELGVPGPVQACQVWLDATNSAQVSCVDLGNPHAVMWVDDVETAALRNWGLALNGPQGIVGGVNLECARVVDRGHAQMRVWERGTGETDACGSGACAVAVVGLHDGRFDSPVTLDLPGGSLVVQWDQAQGPVILSGPVAVVFQGEIPIAPVQIGSNSRH